MKIRRAKERGYADHGWLRSYHTFSFADYHDPDHMGFRALRVINEDRVAPGRGFGTHGHRDMEIISYVLSGKLAHKDSMGTGATIEPGDVQRMSAGTGVQHSEFNASKEDLVHFLQIWIVPDARNLTPSYQQVAFKDEAKRGKLKLVASRAPTDGAVLIHQDAEVFAGLFDAGEKATFEVPKGRYAWLHVARGTVAVDGTELGPGDAVALTPDDPASHVVTGVANGEVLLFDLA